MITTDIVSEVARLLSQRDLGLRDPKQPKEVKPKKSLPEVHDEVELSGLARAFASHEAEPEYKVDQSLKMERLKVMVADGVYHMDEAMVEKIAERIADMLL